MLSVNRKFVGRKASMHAESVPFLMKNRNSLYDERGQIKVTYLSYLIFSKTAVN